MTAIHNHSSRQEFRRNDCTKNCRWKETTKHTRKVKRKETRVEAIIFIVSGSAALKELDHLERRVGKDLEGGDVAYF